MPDCSYHLTVAEIVLREYLRMGGELRRTHAERACHELERCLGPEASHPEIRPARARMERRARLIRSVLDSLAEDDSLPERLRARAEFERSF